MATTNPFDVSTSKPAPQGGGMTAFGTDRATAQKMWNEEAQAKQPSFQATAAPTPADALAQKRQAAIAASRPSAQQTMANQQAQQARLAAADANRQRMAQALQTERTQIADRSALSQQQMGAIAGQQDERLQLFQQVQARQAPPAEAAAPVTAPPPAPVVAAPAPVAAAPAPVAAAPVAAPAPAPVAAPAPAPVAAPAPAPVAAPAPAPAAPAAPAVSAPPAGNAPPMAERAQSLESELRSQYGSNQVAMSRDPRFNVLRMLRAEAQAAQAAQPVPPAAAPTDNTQQRVEQMQGLERQLQSQYGANRAAMSRDPRFAILQKMQADMRSAQVAQAQSLWNEEAARRESARSGSAVAPQNQMRSVVRGRRTRGGLPVGGRRV